MLQEVKARKYSIGAGANKDTGEAFFVMQVLIPSKAKIYPTFKGFSYKYVPQKIYLTKEQFDYEFATFNALDEVTLTCSIGDDLQPVFSLAE